MDIFEYTKARLLVHIEKRAKVEQIKLNARVINFICKQDNILPSRELKEKWGLR